MPGKKVLLVEDDKNLGFVIEDNLTMKGYRVVRCVDGEAGLQHYASQDFDICIFDVMLPKKDGFTLAREIREQDSQTPIIFLTAKSMQDDKLEGFKTGGDDYIVKPFNMEELIYRMEVFLRRATSNGDDSEPESIVIGAYTFDHINYTLTTTGYEKVLTQKEADILKYFTEHIDIVVKREDILKKVWGEDDYFLGRSLDVFISKLRKYLSHDPNIEIINVHGVGFRMKID